MDAAAPDPALPVLAFPRAASPVPHASDASVLPAQGTPAQVALPPPTSEAAPLPAPGPRTLHPSSATSSGRPRNQRVLIRVAVKLQGSINDEILALACQTVAVTPLGADLLCRRNLPLHSRMTLENLATRQRQPCFVSHCSPQSDGGFLLSLEFKQAATDFWQIYFPPAGWRPLDD